MEREREKRERQREQREKREKREGRGWVFFPHVFVQVPHFLSPNSYRPSISASVWRILK